MKKTLSSRSSARSIGRSRPGEEEPQRLRFAAEIPGGADGPLWKIQLEALTEPAAGGGERLKLRAHVQTNLASVARPALAALGQRAMARLPGPAVTTALAPLAEDAARRLGGWAAGRLQVLAPRLSKWAAPLLQHDFNTWFELHASTAPLVQGAKALLPHADKLSALGISPNLAADAPPWQAWQGRIGEELAQVSLLRVDDSQLPEHLRRQLGGKPLQVAAAIVNLVARKP